MSERNKSNLINLVVLYILDWLGTEYKLETVTKIAKIENKIEKHTKIADLVVVLVRSPATDL